MENLNKNNIDDPIIKAQIAGNDAGLEWTRTFIKDFDKTRKIREKCLQNELTLNRVDFANDFNPAVAVFGESQVGKSYLVDNLLTTPKSPLIIYDGKKEDGYGFIASINPIGQGKESTSLISRFTINRYSDNPEYPICAVMLTPIDVVLILCDTYYNDVIKHRFPEKEEIAAMVKSLRERYGKKMEVQSNIKDVDIFEIKDYVENTQFNKGDTFIRDLKNTGFFETLSECIKAIDIHEWRGVFEFLWNRESHISDVFDKLISTLQTLNFAKKCYLKIDPLLRKDGTILQVDRLYELFGFKDVEVDGRIINVDVADVQDMEVWNGEKTMTVLKSVFCALTTEVVFNIANKNNSGNSDLLTEKKFLNDMDVLDFPGARSRLNIPEEQITKQDTCQMLLRGKVAYLFNKYSRQYLISNLMFCHHDTQSNVTTLSGLLKGWIQSTVGNNPKERAEYISSCEVSPLFIVGTKFNGDLVKQPIDSQGSMEEREQAKRARWKKRFNSTLGEVIREPIDDPWFSKWVPDKPFKNMYLLRAYNYSCQSGVYEGYQKRDEGGNWVDNYVNGVRREERINEHYVQFLADLKKTFLENDFVQAHFEDPDKSWEKAVGLNQDGSAWIIENLNRAAEKAFESREKKFKNLLKKCYDNLFDTLKAEYHDDSADSALREALEDAGGLDLKLNTLFGKDKYFFSEFIDTMLVREDDFRDIILNTINGIKVLDNTDLSSLFAVRDEAGVNPDDNEETARQKMKTTYYLSSDEKLDEYLKNYGLTIEDIINPPQVMNIGRVIVTAVEDYWFNNHLQTVRFQEFVNRGLTEGSIVSLFSRMKILYYDELDMTDQITDQITPHISSPQQLDDMVDMLADMISEDINQFVNTMGTVYFGAGQWQRLKDTVAFNKFDINVDVAEQDEVKLDEYEAKKEANTVFDMFDNLETILNEVPVNREKLQHFSNYRTFRQWTERMKVAFLAICGVPNYDVNANNALKAIFLNRIIGAPELKDYASKKDISCFKRDVPNAAS